MLEQQELVTIDGLRYAFQVYTLPWPVSDREFLIHCDEQPDEAAQVFVSECRCVLMRAFDGREALPPTATRPHNFPI
jgi:hypothetical protein